MYPPKAETSMSLACWLIYMTGKVLIRSNTLVMLPAPSSCCLPAFHLFDTLMKCCVVPSGCSDALTPIDETVDTTKPHTFLFRIGSADICVIWKMSPSLPNVYTLVIGLAHQISPIAFH